METNEKTYDKYLLSHTYYMQIWYILCPTYNSVNTIKKKLVNTKQNQCIYTLTNHHSIYSLVVFLQKKLDKSKTKQNSFPSLGKL